MPKKPFSGKQKKQQLKEKRDKKKGSHGHRGCYDDDDEGSDSGSKKESKSQAELQRINQQPINSKDFDPNRYRLHFLKITPEEMKRRKAAAHKPIVKVPENDLEISWESVHGPGTELDFPKRPPWNFSLSKQKLDQQEQEYFKQYVCNLLSTNDSEHLSYFELNLETWRQLWRVTDISDMLLLIADIRYPILHLPPSLYRYMRDELKRDIIIVLNKVDLSPPPLVAAWHSYLKLTFPDAHIVCFTAFPKEPEETGTGLFSKQKKKKVKAVGPMELLDICKQLVGDKVNLDSWQHKLDTQDIGTSAPERHDDEEGAGAGSNDLDPRHSDHGYAGVYKRFRDGILTIGCIGFPNVGKSSLLNGLVGKKVVSVSKTPGHTKHLQTIFLTPTVRLCDCPGLVFPSYVDKALQVLSGIYPIAQVREPYSSIAYIAARLDLPRLLHIAHPELEGKPPTATQVKNLVWSSYDICEGYAIKSGYYTAKASRPDVYRAANQLLRMAVEGRLRVCFAPPGYFENLEKWKADPFAVRLLQQMEKEASGSRQAQSGDSESDNEEEHSSEGDSGGEKREGGESEEDEEAENHVHKNPFALLAGD